MSWPEWADRVDVCTDDLGDTTCKEVPYDNASVVTADGKQRPPAVKGAGQSHADTVQCAICFLLDMMHNTYYKHKQQQYASLHYSSENNKTHH